MSTLNVDKVDPSTGTALELGTSGDTITVPTGAGLTVTDEVKTNKVSPATGTAFTLGDSGDTFTVPSGATIVNSGTATGFGITRADFRPNAQPYMINGNFNVWQRGTSFTTAVFTADRWKQDLSGATATVTRETHTVGQTDVPDNPTYYLKQNVTTGNGNCGMLYKIEDVSTMTGTFTLSFYAKGVNPAGGNLDIVIQQNFGSGGSGTVGLTEQDLTLTASWQQFVFTGTLASISGKTVGTDSYIQFIFKQPDDDTATDAWNLQISQIQFESGTFTSATLPAFQNESYGDNLARCQRYLNVCIDQNYRYAGFGIGWYQASGTFRTLTRFSVVMRGDPSLFSSTATNEFYIYSTSADYTDEVAISADTNSSIGLITVTNNVSGTAGYGGGFFAENADAYIWFEAEL